MKNSRIAVFGGSFNPPGLHHKSIVKALTKYFDKVLIVPCGIRSDKPTTNFVSAEHRAEMIKLTFADLPKTEVLLFDLEDGEFTPTYELDRSFRSQYSQYDGEIWHVIGTDLVVGGAKGESEIQKQWFKGPEIWENLLFCVISRKGYELDYADLPHNFMLTELNILGSSTEIREKIKNEEPIDGLVAPEVANYIKENKLYKIQEGG